jgi:hypothetical protein
MANIFDINKFNDFINSANQALSCGPDCQKQKLDSSLKQKYLEAQSNVITAPNQLEKATQNYITFTQGESGYNEYIEQKLEEKAQIISDTYSEKFNQDVKKINSEISTYKGLLINFYNVVELFKKYKIENTVLENKLKIKTSDILTNDRKTYYEDQGNDNLRFYFIIFLIIYYIIFLIYIFFIFIYSSTLSWKSHLAIIVFLSLYPFIGTYLIEYLIYFYNIIIDLLPKNVYKNL